MTNTLTRRILGSATALGASMALLGTGLAGAAPSSTLSSQSGGSAESLGSGGSNTMSATGESEDPLSYSLFNTCDIEATRIMGGPNGTIPFGNCIEAVVRGGTMTIGDFTIPIPDGSLRISGGAQPHLNDIGFPTGENDFIPARGTEYGVFHRDLPVPGGALGTSSAENFGLTSVEASVEAVGMPKVDLFSLTIDMPVRVKLSNPLLGDNCYLGTPENPIQLHLTPRSPDDVGKFTSIASRYPDSPGGTLIAGATDVANDFAVPGATGCGPFGSLNWLVNARAHTPSPAGNNSLTVTFDAYMSKNLQDVIDWRKSNEQP